MLSQVVTLALAVFLGFNQEDDDAQGSWGSVRIKTFSSAAAVNTHFSNINAVLATFA